MDRVEEIKSAIDRLPPEDYRRVVAWLRAREQKTSDEKTWDDRIDHDSASGKLDHLFAEADAESSQGPPRDWPTRGSNR
jgi:hypothetical protein